MGRNPSISKETRREKIRMAIRKGTLSSIRGGALDVIREITEGLK